MNSHIPGIVPAPAEGLRSEPPPLRPWSEEDEIDLAPDECIEQDENEDDADRIEDEDERRLQEERRTFDTPDPDADDPEPR